MMSGKAFGCGMRRSKMFVSTGPKVWKFPDCEPNRREPYGKARISLEADKEPRIKQNAAHLEMDSAM